jgi:putative flippase GtrA
VNGEGDRRRQGRTVPPRLTGQLTSPDSGLFGRGVRFAIAGAVVMVVYVTTTTVLAQVFGVPFQIAIATGYLVGLCVHFTLQRMFVWVHHEEFVLSIYQQASRYLLWAGLQYGTTAVLVAVLPSLLHLPTQLVYFGVVALVTAANFLVFQNKVFHAGPSDPASLH